MILFTILQADRYIDRNMFLTLSEKIYSFSIKILEQMRIVTTKSATATGNTHTNTYRVNATKLSSKGSFALGDNDDNKKWVAWIPMGPFTLDDDDMMTSNYSVTTSSCIGCSTHFNDNVIYCE